MSVVIDRVRVVCSTCGIVGTSFVFWDQSCESYIVTGNPTDECVRLGHRLNQYIVQMDMSFLIGWEEKAYKGGTDGTSVV
jgi:transcription initiation factor TFIIIB Brf1 subunit/transcription initiation factor TFIIB